MRTKMLRNSRVLFGCAVFLSIAAPSQADLLWYSPMDGNANTAGSFGANPFQVVGTPVATSNRFGMADTAVFFNGGARYDITRPTNLLEAASVSLWVRLDDPNSTEIGPIAVGGSDGGSIDYFTILRYSGDASSANFRSDLDDGITRRDVQFNGVTVGQWHHFAATFEVNTGSGTTRHCIYVDGVGHTNVHESAEIINISYYPWIVGAERTFGRYWIGAIDDVGIWNNALTEAQIQELASGAKAPPQFSGVDNVGPVANAGLDQKIYLPTNNAAFAGSATDFDGEVVGYHWEQTSGPSQADLYGTNTATLVVSNLVMGSYAFRLTATDEEDATGSDSVIVVVADQPALVWYSTMNGNANPARGFGSAPTTVGTPSPTTNRDNEVAGAVHLDGSAYYNLGKPVERFVAATVACWFKYESADELSRGLAGVGGSYSYGSGPFFALIWLGNTADGPNKLRSDYSIGTGTRKDVYGQTLAPGEWHHVAMTFEVVGANTVHSIYVDGQLKEVDTYLGFNAALVPGKDWLIGAENVANPSWIGAIDDFAIWNTALTAEQVASLYPQDGKLPLLPPEIFGPRIPRATLMILK